MNPNRTISRYPIARIPAPAGWPVLLAILFLLASPVDAREQSSKRDCAICHVMWLDEFRSTQETLIPWQPGNVLMKNTQGVVSSEDSCYTCHDGYVRDSRAVAWKGKSHPSMIKPSRKVSVPASLPLSRKDELYCGTCHTPHTGPEESAEIPLEITSFLRTSNPTVTLCAMCHQDKADFQRTNGHPLKPLPRKLPALLRTAGSKIGPDGRTLVCQTCHRVHGARGDKISIMADTSATLCTACHAEKTTIVGTRHDLRLDPKTKKDAKVYKWGTCGGCHSPHDANGKRLWNRDIGNSNPASGMCLSCHSEGPDSVARGIGKVSHSVDRRPAKPPADGLPLYLTDGRPSAHRGKVQCFTCHNVHRWAPEDESRLPPENGQGDGGNSFLRVPSARNSALCLNCHQDKATVIDTAHNMVHTAPEIRNTHSATAAASGPCSACHLPHNAMGWKLWARPLDQGHPATQTCLSCHGDLPWRPGKTTGRSHPLNVALAPGSPLLLPGFTPKGDISTSGSMQCATCHDVHRWRPGALAKSEDPKQEGDAGSSFLRMANQDRAALCVGCHRRNGRVSMTEHHIGQIFPDHTNSLGIRADSDPCSGCHAPHQGTADRLWGLAPGPGGDPVTRRCASCHRPGGLADKKLVNDNSHPVGRKVENKNRWMSPKAGGLAALPLYSDPQGEEDLMVCTTCHDAHVWSAAGRKESPGAVNTEGDTTTSFLRRPNNANSSLCRDCHPKMSRVDGTTHDLTVSAPESRNVLGQTPTESGVCGGCHIVHNSPRSLKLWARPLTDPDVDEIGVNMLCRSCHAAGKIAARSVPQAAGHPTGRLLSTIRRPGAPDSGEGFPLFDAEGRRRRVGDLGCPSCHNAHQGVASGTRMVKLKSDDILNKYLRVGSANTVCAACHGPEGLYRYLYYHDPRRRKG